MNKSTEVDYRFKATRGTIPVTGVVASFLSKLTEERTIIIQEVKPFAYTLKDGDTILISRGKHNQRTIHLLRSDALVNYRMLLTQVGDEIQGGVVGGDVNEPFIIAVWSEVPPKECNADISHRTPPLRSLGESDLRSTGDPGDADAGLGYHPDHSFEQRIRREMAVMENNIDHMINATIALYARIGGKRKFVIHDGVFSDISEEVVRRSTFLLNEMGIDVRYHNQTRTYLIDIDLNSIRLTLDQADTLASIVERAVKK